MHAVRHREEMHTLLIWVQDAKDGESDGGAWHLQVLWVFDITELKS